MVTSITLAQTTHTVTASDTNYTVTVSPTVHTIELQTGAGLQGPGYTFTTDTVDPSSAPASIGRFWYNTTTGRLWVALGTSSLQDWHELLVGMSP